MTRTRQQDTRSILNATRVTTYKDGTTSSSAINFGPRVGTFREIVDEVVPGFARRRAAGEVFMNPASYYTQVWSWGGPGGFVATRSSSYPLQQNDHVNAQVDSYPHYFWSGRAPVEYATLVDATAMQTRVITQTWANVSKPDVEGLVALAELSQTIALLKNPLRELQKFVVSYAKAYSWNLKRVRKYRTQRVDEYLSSEYLKFRYGVTPLLSDIEGILKAAERIHGEHRKTARALEYDTQEVVTQYNGVSTPYWYYDIEDVRSETCKVRAGVLYTTDISLNSSFGMSATNIPSAIWETIPFSFVVDWLVNVGDLVRAFSPIVGNRYLASWVTRTREASRTRTVKNFARVDPYYTTTQSMNGTFDRVDHKGTARENMSIYDAGLSFKFNLSNTQIADSIALIIQQIARLR